MARIAIVNSYGSFLSVKDGRFQLKHSGKIVWDLAPTELEAIVFTIDGALISTAAVKLANQFFIDLVFLDGVEPVARLVQARYSPPLKTWIRQVKAYRRSRVELAKLFVEGKIHNQRMVLSDYAKRFRAQYKPNYDLESSINEIMNLESKILECRDVEEVRGIEALVARYYWRHVAEIVPDSLGFTVRIPRSRRPPVGGIDSFNKALNIGYSALLREVWRAVFIAGLNPYLGFLHKPKAGKMVLVFDLMEEFRPIAVDRPLIALARRNVETLLKLKGDDVEAVKEVWRVVVKHMREGNPSIQSIILEQARKLAKHVRGEGEYKPFKARW